MTLQENLKPEHIRVKLQRRKKPARPVLQRRSQPARPVLLRRKKSVVGSLLGGKEKERSKEKENIYNNIYNKKNILSHKNTPYSSSFINSFLPVKTGKKEELSKTQRRARLNSRNNYKPKKTETTKEAFVTKEMQMIFNTWDNLAKEYKNLVLIGNKKRTTKKFKETCSVVRALLHGKLNNHKSVVLPKYGEKIIYPKLTPREFEKHTGWFALLLQGKLKFLTSVDLLNFIAGTSYTGFPSILLAYSWKEPDIGFNNEEYFGVLKDRWHTINENTLSINDYKNFDTYFEWALPHFKNLRKNLNSLNSFDDELDVLEFFTFAALNKFKERGKICNTGILNQDFFKNIMEDSRKNHGYIV